MARQGDYTYRDNGVSFENKYVTRNEVGLNAGGMQITGSNTYGALGDGTTTNVSSPIVVGTETDWKVAASTIGYRTTYRATTYAIKQNGTLWSWGSNYLGKLGQGLDPTTITGISTPMQVGTDSDWKKIVPRAGAVILDNAGRLYWTGDYALTYALDASANDISTFQQFGSDRIWADIWISRGNSGLQGIMAREHDNSLWFWGYTFYHWEGAGDATMNTSSPTLVGDATDWSQFDVGLQHSLLIKTNGTLWSCGGNAWGQLGHGDQANISTFTQIGTDTDWEKVICTSATSYAIKTDGTLYSWGYDGYGNLGQGTFSTHLSSPIQVGALTTWSGIYGGEEHVIAKQTDGSMFGWGAGFGGGAGTGAAGNVQSPIPVLTSLVDWRFITVGSTNAIWIQY